MLLFVYKSNVKKMKKICLSLFMNLTHLDPIFTCLQYVFLKEQCHEIFDLYFFHESKYLSHLDS